MPKFVTSKFGTKINVDGLNEAQIKKVLSVAQDKGAYGTKAQALAKQLAKKNASGGSGGSMPSTGGGYDLGVGSQGKINQEKATEAAVNATNEDFERNFNANNPGSQTDVFGNRQDITFDPTTGQSSINQTAGQNVSAALQAFLTAANDFGGAGSAAEAAQKANYNFITRDYNTQKQAEMEAAKTELTNRGIPLDTRPDSLWMKTMGNIDSKYQNLFDQANNQAITTGNQTLATRAGALGTVGSTLQSQAPTFSQFVGSESNMAPMLQNLMQLLSQSGLTRMQIQNQNRGGGGAPADNSPIIGGNAPGFGV